MTGRHEARDGSLRADLERGVRYALARRRKAVAALVALATQLVAAQVLTGRALLIASAVIVLAGGKTVETVSNRPPAPRPGPG